MLSQLRGIFLFVSKVEQMETELRKLSQDELRRIRECLDNLIEDELEFTPEFVRSIPQSVRDRREGKTAGVREPGGACAPRLRFTTRRLTRLSSNCLQANALVWKRRLTI